VALPKAEQAKELRRSMTRFETLLWYELKARKLGGYKFRRQAPIGPYIADFCAHAVRLVVEIDGPNHDERLEADAARTRYLEARGFRVIRLRADDELLRREEMLEAILLACRAGEERVAAEK
jgi:very-short-patch-repair endonuclease